jgi:hypothetical protein
LGTGEDSREVWVFGRAKGEVSKRAAAFLRVILKSFPTRIKGEKIEREGKGSNAAALLKNLSKRDADWKAAILLAGQSYGGYAIAPMSADPRQKIRQKDKKNK